MSRKAEGGHNPTSEWEPPWRKPRVREAWTGRDFLLAGIGVGAAFGIAVTGLVGWYVLPAWHQNPGRAQVAVTPEYVLTGPSASVWKVTICPPGNYSLGEFWTCSVSLKDMEGGTSPPTRTVDEIQASPLTLIAVSPSTPQSIQSGGSLNFQLQIGLNFTISTSSVNLAIVIDSR